MNTSGRRMHDLRKFWGEADGGDSEMAGTRTSTQSEGKGSHSAARTASVRNSSCSCAQTFFQRCSRALPCSQVGGQARGERAPGLDESAGRMGVGGKGGAKRGVGKAAAACAALLEAAAAPKAVGFTPGGRRVRPTRRPTGSAGTTCHVAWRGTPWTAGPWDCSGSSRRRRPPRRRRRRRRPRRREPRAR